jgi:hypothetical protein
LFLLLVACIKTRGANARAFSFITLMHCVFTDVTTHWNYNSAFFTSFTTREK